MKNFKYVFFVSLFAALSSFAQQTFTYKGKTLSTGKDIYYVDHAKQTDSASFVFNNLVDAIRFAEKRKADDAKHLLTIYIAPYVYWMDDPDDPAIRMHEGATMPSIGMKVRLSNVKMVGLGGTPDDVVVCSNRGNDFGASNFYTMFYWTGSDVSAENITFGNYCSIDLNYTKNPKLSRKRRTNTLARSSIARTFGDRYYFKDCKFMGRAAMQPFVGANRTLYENCTMECSENGLNDCAVYENCKISLFSDKPLMTTLSSGVIFLNCDFYAVMKKQYINRAGGGPIVMVDCRWDNINQVADYNWTLRPVIDERNYIYNVTTVNDNKPIKWQTKMPVYTVDMTGKDVLKAYKNDDGTYNIYNLVCGDDGWNPQNIEKNKFHNGPTQIVSTQRNITIESEVDEYKLRAKEYYFADIEDVKQPHPIKWNVYNNATNIINITPSPDGLECIVKGVTTDDQEHSAYVTMQNDYGLEAACRVNLIPKQMPVPNYTVSPALTVGKDNNITLSYQLNLSGDLKDKSVVNWYRSGKDAQGKPDTTKWYRILSTNDEPIKMYKTDEADNGCYIMAEIAAKHQRCLASDSIVRCITTAPLKSKLKIKQINADFTTMSGKVQPVIDKGLWTYTIYKPKDTEKYIWAPERKDDNVYIYDTGTDGALGEKGFNQAHRGARMVYTPMGDKYTDMDVVMQVAPLKNAGQGFSGSNMQYMDIYIKYDTKNMNGYGLRIIRTKKFNGAVDFVLMKFTNGEAKEIADPVTATGFRNGCTIHMNITGRTFTATATNPDNGDPIDVGLPVNAELIGEIEPNEFGGFGIQHTGVLNGASCLIKTLNITWK